MNKRLLEGLACSCLTILWFVPSMAQCQDSSQASKARYAVMEFKGTSEFTHANQPIIGGGGFETDTQASTLDEGVSTASTHYFLILDMLEHSLYIFYDMSLWSLSRGEPDPLQTLWEIHGEHISNESSLGRPLPPELIWSPKTGKLFAEIFQLPVEAPLDQLMSKIEQQCVKPNLGESDDRLTGGSHCQRLVQSSGDLVVFNETQSGQSVVTIRAERSPNTATQFRCKLIAFTHEKPVETIDGELTVSTSSEFPPSVATWRDNNRQKAIEPSVSGNAQSPPVLAPSTKEDTDTFTWSGAIAVLGGISLIGTLVGFYFMGRFREGKK